MEARELGDVIDESVPLSFSFSEFGDSFTLISSFMFSVLESESSTSLLSLVLRSGIMSYNSFKLSFSLLLLLPLKSRNGRSGIPTLCANDVGVETEDKNPIVIIKKVT